MKLLCWWIKLLDEGKHVTMCWHKLIGAIKASVSIFAISHIIAIVHFTAAYLVSKLPLNSSEGDFVMIQLLLLSNANYFVIMLTRYWSLWQQGHLQPYSKSKTWQVSTKWVDTDGRTIINYLQTTNTCIKINFLQFIDQYSLHEINCALSVLYTLTTDPPELFQQSDPFSFLCVKFPKIKPSNQEIITL